MVLLIISQIKRQISYRRVTDSKMANIFAISTIGTGKSTLMNKLVHLAQNGDNYHSSKLRKVFEAGENTTGLTFSMNSKKVIDQNLKKWNLIDTPGYADPNRDTKDMWN